MQEITIYLYGLTFTAKPSQPSWWEPVLRELQGVKVEKFDVVLPWTEEECERVEERGYPFKLWVTENSNDYDDDW